MHRPVATPLQARSAWLSSRQEVLAGLARRGNLSADVKSGPP